MNVGVSKEWYLRRQNTINHDDLRECIICCVSVIETAIVNYKINVKEFILCSWLKARILIGWKKWFKKKYLSKPWKKYTRDYELSTKVSWKK